MIKPPSFWNTRGLTSAEWLAENAFLPPGLHRLLTVFGLSSGLWLGRQFTDFVVARRSTDGSEIPRSQVPELFRPLHGVMSYNQYSDNPTDRWKSVADGALPVAFGVLGAYLGSKHFFHGKPSELLFGKNVKPLHGPSSKIRNLNLAKPGESGGHVFSLPQAIGKMHLNESDAARGLGAISFTSSGVAGGQMAAAWAGPGSAAFIAVPFQIGALRNINLPKTGIKFIDKAIIKFNRGMGNYSAGSRAMPDSIMSLVKWAEGNISKDHAHNFDFWMTDSELFKRAQDMLQNFRKLPDSEYKAVGNRIGEELRSITKEAKEHAWDSKKLFDTLQSRFSHFEADKLIIQGLQSPKSWENFILSHHGPFTQVNRLNPKYIEQERGMLKHLATRLEPMLKERYGVDVKLNTQVTPHPLIVGSVIAGGTTASVGALSLAASHHKKQRENAFEDDPKYQHTRQAEANRNYTAKKEKPKNVIEWINDKPLDVSQWFSRILIQPPSMHRFMSAFFLSGALFGGYKFANVLTGRSLLSVRGVSNADSIIARKDVWGIFKPFHNVLEYTPGSSAIQDRWRQALHMIIPVGIGAVGTSLGSHFYFSDRIKRITSDKAVYLEDYADKITLEQSKFYAGATAVTSIYNTGSGIHLLPFFNYSANLQNRFVMAGGYQVALPGVGKWWSGNEGLYPWGIKRTLDFTTKYLAYNTAEFPEQLPSLVHAVLGKLYPKMPNHELAGKERDFIEEIYKVRDTFLVDKHVPKEKGPELLKAMKAVLTGAGFEKTLMAAGLDPLKANIGNNGVSGAIANTTGQGMSVNHLKSEYKQRFTERLAKQRETTEIPQHKKPEKPISDRPFSERVKTDSNTIPVSL